MRRVVVPSLVLLALFMGTTFALLSGDDEPTTLVESTAPTVQPTAPSTPAPTPTPRPLLPEPPVTAVVAGLDGIGPVSFGDPDTTALPALIEIFGPPDVDVMETLREARGYESQTEPWATVSSTLVAWSGVTAVFTDLPVFRSDGVMHLVAWHAPSTSVPPVATAEGIGVGSTLNDVVAVYPEATVSIDPCTGRPTALLVETPVGDTAAVIQVELENDVVVVMSGGVLRRDLESC